MEAHHRVNGPDTGRNSGGRRLKNHLENVVATLLVTLAWRKWRSGVLNQRLGVNIVWKEHLLGMMKSEVILDVDKRQPLTGLIFLMVNYYGKSA